MKRYAIIIAGILAIATIFSIQVSGQESFSIPQWVKNNAKWWGEDQISDSEFVKGMQYLVESGIIVVNNQQQTQIANLQSQIQDLQNQKDSIQQTLDNEKTKESNLQSQINQLQIENNQLQQQIQSSQSISQPTQTTQQTNPSGLTKEEIQILAKTNPLIQGLISGQINFYIDPVPNYAAPGVSDLVEKIANGLGTVGYGQIKLNRVYDVNEADIHITWIRDFGGDPIGLTNFKSIIQIGLGEENCYGDWQAFDSQTILKIMVHELGHAMGFKHDTDPNNIMYPTLNTKFYTDYEKSITLNTGYYVPVQFCKNGSYFYEISTDDQYNGLDVYVAPSSSSYNGISSGNDLYYPSCSVTNVISFNHSCNVEAGSKIWIFNHQNINSKPDQIKVKITDTNQPTIMDFTWKTEDSAYNKQTLDYIWNLFH